VSDSDSRHGADAVPPRTARKVECPACGKPALYAPSNPWRPFCSERCRVTDLGGWASEAYRIPAKPGGEDEEGGGEGSRG
jgi:endogenous inhibitor of DNA gyrase (YacG/DUF329 family)